MSLQQKISKCLSHLLLIVFFNNRILKYFFTFLIHKKFYCRQKHQSQYHFYKRQFIIIQLKLQLRFKKQSCIFIKSILILQLKKLNNPMSNPQQIIGNFLKNLIKIKRYNMFEVPLPNQQAIKKTKIEINQKMTTYYKQPLLKKYLNSLTVKKLLDQSVVMFVGSRTRPKSITLRDQLIKIAKIKAQDKQKNLLRKHLIQKQKNKKNESNQSKNTKNSKQQQTQINFQNTQKQLTKYYSYAFVKYEAMQTNNQKSWDQSMMFIKQLADKGHPLSCMLLAKQYYSRIGYQQMGKQARVELLIHSADYFLKSVTQVKFYPQIKQTNLNGVYYIGQILRQFPELQQVSQNQIQECFIYAAAHGNPLAYFNLAKMHQKRGDIKLYIKYLKSAAQGGCLQAQHNLAEEYLRGLNIKKDNVKAFSWHVNAGAHGFVYSKNNAALMLLNGSDCGRIKPNKKAALIYFQEIQRTDTLDVQEYIKLILQDSQIKRQNQEQQKMQRINQSKNLKSITKGQ